MTRNNAIPHRGLSTFIAISIGCVLAALAAEALARLFFDEPVLPRFVIDSGYGVRWNEAHVDTHHYVPGEYDVRITTNSVGMRGPREYPVVRTPGTQRVELIGDSFTFGFGVEDNEVISAVLEDMLNQHCGSRSGGSSASGSSSSASDSGVGAEAPPTGARCAEVLNLGVSGFGQAEELVTWQNLGVRYRPDVVVILYFDNDIGNNAVAKLFSVRDNGSVVRTGKEYLPGSRLQQWLFAIAPVRWLFEHSQAWNLIRNRLSQLVQKAKLREQGLQTFNDATPAGVALTRGLLGELVREIRAAGARPIIFIIPNQDHLRSNFPLTAAEVAALGAELVDGRALLAPSDYYHRDGHWRASGHRKAAAALAAVID